MPLYKKSAPRNSSFNVILNLSVKGVSKLYSRMKDSFSQDIEIEIESFSLNRSFQKHHLKYKDTYLKYIQFRTLHHTSLQMKTFLRWESRILIYAAFVLKRLIQLNRCY